MVPCCTYIHIYVQVNCIWGGTTMERLNVKNCYRCNAEISRIDKPLEKGRDRTKFLCDDCRKFKIYMRYCVRCNKIFTSTKKHARICHDCWIISDEKGKNPIRFDMMVKANPEKYKRRLEEICGWTKLLKAQEE